MGSQERENTGARANGATATFDRAFGVTLCAQSTGTLSIASWSPYSHLSRHTLDEVANSHRQRAARGSRRATWGISGQALGMAPRDESVDLGGGEVLVQKKNTS